MADNNLFPMFLKLAGRPCLVAGAGQVGEPKIKSLIDSGARVTTIAMTATDRVQLWAEQKRLVWHQRSFITSDLDGVFLAIAATSSPVVNELIFVEAQRRGVLCNSVDDPMHCDFYYGAVVRRGELQIAISTAGQSPALAQQLRQQLEFQFDASYGPWLAELGRVRQHLMASGLDAGRRKQILHHLANQRASRQVQKKPIERTAARGA